MDVNCRCNRASRQKPAFNVDTNVGLIQEDDGGGPAAPGLCDVALDPAQVEVAIQSRNKEDDVDIGSYYLFTGGGARTFSLEGASSREQVVYGQCLVLDVGRHEDPVPYDDTIAGCDESARQGTGGLGWDEIRSRMYDESVFILAKNAGQAQSGSVYLF